MQIVLCSHTCNPQVPPTVNATGGSQCFFLRQPPTNPTGFRGRPGVSRWVPACAPNLVLRCAPACALAQWGTKLGACAGAHRGTKLGVTSVGPMGNHWPQWGGQDGAQAEAQVGTKSPLVPTACSPLWTSGLPLRVFQMGSPSSIPAPKQTPNGGQRIKNGAKQETKRGTKRKTKRGTKRRTKWGSSMQLPLDTRSREQRLP